MLPDPFSRPHKEKRGKAVWQRETKTTRYIYNYISPHAVHAATSSRSVNTAANVACCSCLLHGHLKHHASKNNYCAVVCTGP